MILSLEIIICHGFSTRLMWSLLSGYKTDQIKRLSMYFSSRIIFNILATTCATCTAPPSCKRTRRAVSSSPTSTPNTLLTSRPRKTTGTDFQNSEIKNHFYRSETTRRPKLLHLLRSRLGRHGPFPWLPRVSLVLSSEPDPVPTLLPRCCKSRHTTVRGGRHEKRSRPSEVLSDKTPMRE